MIYKLDTDFTKIEQGEGVIQNLSRKNLVEIVICEEKPEKDSGILLRPLKIFPYKAPEGKFIFARTAHICGKHANVAVIHSTSSKGEDEPMKPGAGVAVGSILYGHFLMPGYVEANGQLLSRVEYADLYACATENELILPEEEWAKGMQGMYGQGDGRETFRVPDLRGQFLRGLDRGAGIDANRVLGSRQEDAIRNIKAAGKGSMNDVIRGADVPLDTGAFQFSYIESCLQAGNSGGVYLIDFDASRVVPTAKENRPKNVALIAQIKY